MKMRREGLFVTAALAVALGTTPIFGQDDTGNRRQSDLNVSIGLEGASQSRAAVADLQLPIEQESRPSSAPPEQERRFAPADFARPNRLESLQMAVDDLPRGATAVAVRCQAFIGRDSSLGEYHCVADDNRAYEDVVQAVIDAVPTQRFVAARVDNENVRVLMNFAVYVDCSSGSCLAVAARNHGYHVENLGLDYIDPQPILDGDEWYVGFDYKLRWIRAWMPRISSADRREARPRLPYVLAAEIDASGIAAAACLYWVFSISAPDRVGVSPLGANSFRTNRASSFVPSLPLRTIRDIEGAIASLGSVRYVPGMIDGAPTTLRLYERSVTNFEEVGARFGVGDIDCN
jgi:hypothetical protein